MTNRKYGNRKWIVQYENTYFISHISGRFKSKETDFVGFITKIHISR